MIPLRSGLPPLDFDLRWARNHCWPRGDEQLRVVSPAYALWLVLDGAVDLTLYEEHPPARRSLRVSAGESFLAPPLLRDVRITQPSGAHWLTIGITAILPGPIDALAALHPPFLWHPSEEIRTTLTDLMTRITAEFGERQWLDGSLASLVSLSLAQAVFGILWRERCGDIPPGSAGSAFSRVTQTTLPDWLSRTLQRIAEDPALHLPELMETADLSPSQFRRGFHRWLNMSPQVYLTRQRLEVARIRLETTDQRIVDIALAVGFDSLAHFTRLFKQVYGLPPGRYRSGTRRPNV